MGDGARPFADVRLTVTTPTLRAARDSDLDAIHDIECDAFADPWSRDAIASSMAVDRILFLVAEEAGATRGQAMAGGAKILGYVVALLLFDEAEIANLAVAADARCRGIGGLLLDRAVTDAATAGVRSLYLEVRESNAAARALYRSRSFVEVGRRRGYYRRPSEDALVLKREIGTT